MRFEEQYLELMVDVIHYGQKRPDRTGTGTRSQFGRMLTADLSREFPILVTKPVAWKTCLRELLWMISGSTNVRPLQEQGVHIWDAWADEDGELGPVYGAQWRHSGFQAYIAATDVFHHPDFGLVRRMTQDQYEKWQQKYSPTYYEGMYVDQLANVIESLRDDPFSRRHIVNSWNVQQLDHMRLPPCHYAFQFYVDYANPGSSDDPKLRLNCLVNMRSSDLPVGLPFNVVAYATLTLMLCRELGYAPGELKISMGDAHVYENQIDQALAQEMRLRNNGRLGAPMSDDYLDRKIATSAFGEQMQRERLAYPLQGRGPKLLIKPSFQSVLSAKIEDFDLLDYNPIEPKIEYPVAV